MENEYSYSINSYNDIILSTIVYGYGSRYANLTDFHIKIIKFAIIYSI